jgi:MFS family permease
VVAAVSRSPSLRRVELAFLLFNAVEFATWVAILLYAYEATGPATLGLVAAVQLIPAALTAPFAALLADRPQRTHALAIGYLIQAAAFGTTAACMALALPPLVVYAAAAVAASSLGCTRPTQGALLPELARTPEELSVANGVSGSVEGAGLFVGPILAAAILTVGTPAFVFVAGAVAFVAAATLVASLPPTRRQSEAPNPAAASESPRPLTPVPARLDVLDGLRVVRQNRDVRLVVTILALRMLVIGALDVLFVLLALEVYGTGQPGAGILTGALGVGTMLGGFVAFTLVGRRRLAPALGAAVSILGMALVIASVVATGSSAPAFIVVVGIGSAVADVAGRTILQRSAPDAVLGRVLGNLEGFGLFGTSAGSILAPVIAIVVGIQGALAVVGAVLPLAVLLGWRGLRAIDRRTRVPELELALLEHNPVFSPLPPPALVQAAAGAGAQLRPEARIEFLEHLHALARSAFPLRLQFQPRAVAERTEVAFRGSPPILQPGHHVHEPNLRSQGLSNSSSVFCDHFARGRKIRWKENAPKRSRWMNLHRGTALTWHWSNPPTICKVIHLLIPLHDVSRNRICQAVWQATTIGGSGSSLKAPRTSSSFSFERCRNGFVRNIRVNRRLALSSAKKRGDFRRTSFPARQVRLEGCTSMRPSASRGMSGESCRLIIFGFDVSGRPCRAFVVRSIKERLRPGSMRKNDVQASSGVAGGYGGALRLECRK